MIFVVPVFILGDGTHATDDVIGQTTVHKRYLVCPLSTVVPHALPHGTEHFSCRAEKLQWLAVSQRSRTTDAGWSRIRKKSVNTSVVLEASSYLFARQFNLLSAMDPELSRKSAHIASVMAFV